MGAKHEACGNEATENSSAKHKVRWSEATKNVSAKREDRGCEATENANAKHKARVSLKCLGFFFQKKSYKAKTNCSKMINFGANVTKTALRGLDLAQIGNYDHVLNLKYTCMALPSCLFCFLSMFLSISL